MGKIWGGWGEHGSNEQLDLVLLDIIAGFDGYEVLKRLKADPSCSMKVVMLTTSANE